MRDIILYFSIKYQGKWEKIFNAITSKEAVEQNQIEKIISKVKNKYITIVDDNYPSTLKGVERPPFVLFYKGNINLLKNKVKSLYINSTLNPSSYKIIRNYINSEFKNYSKLLLVNEKTTIELKKLSKNIVDDKTIGLMLSGINSCYSKISLPLYHSIIKNGLLLSEYPDIAYEDEENKRNSLRIFSALSSEIFMPKVYKDIDSYNLLSYCIDNDTSISTMDLKNKEGYANNFLINEGAKNISK